MSRPTVILRTSAGRVGCGILVACALLLAPLPTHAQDLVAYPSYRPRFNAETETFSLRSSIYVVNTGDHELRDVVIRQEVPDGITIKLTDLGESQGIRRPEGFQENVKANTYEMRIPVLRPKEGTLVLSDFQLDRRVWERTFPGLSLQYTNGEEREETRLREESYELAVYSDHVGSLARFLKKYALVSLELTDGGRREWEFALQDAAATGSNPSGILGVVRKHDREGFFRIRTGHPGDLLEIIAAWRPVEIRERLVEPMKVVKRMEEYLRWVGDFRFQKTTLKLVKKKFLGYKDSFILNGRWKDQVANRLGEGPFRAIVFQSPKEGVEYYLLFLAQARGMGPEASETPQPERETRLMEELIGYSETFKSHIEPLSYQKR